MSDSEQRNLELSARQLLLNFYGSEINTHGRLFIGFAALIFTIISVRATFKTGKIALNIWQLGIIYFAVFISGLAIFYVLFRLIGYGYFANSVIHAPSSCNLIKNECTEQSFIYPLVADIQKHAFNSSKGESKILGLFPVKCFMSGKEQWKGKVISFLLSLFTTFLFFLLLEL